MLSTFSAVFKHQEKFKATWKSLCYFTTLNAGWVDSDGNFHTNVDDKRIISICQGTDKTHL